MSKRGEVSDFAVRDMLEKPAEVDTKDMGDSPSSLRIKQFLDKVGKQVNEKNGTHFDAVLILTPSKQPRGVIDAKPEAHCDNCNQEVWVSPSSRARLHDTIKICSECLLTNTVGA